MRSKIPDPVTISLIAATVASTAIGGLQASGQLGPKQKDPAKEAQKAAAKADQQRARMQSLLAREGGRNLTQRTQGQGLGAAPVTRPGLSGTLGG